MPTEELHQGSGVAMKLNRQASDWLKANKERIENGSKSVRRLSNEQAKAKRRQSQSRKQATRLKAKYLAHPSAQYLMTFSDFRDLNKRDAICRQYGVEHIRV